MKKYCCKFHQFFKYRKTTKQLKEYCNFTSLNQKKNKAGDKLCQHVGKMFLSEICLITMSQKKDVDHHFWTVSEMLIDSWINKL